MKVRHSLVEPFKTDVFLQLVRLIEELIFEAPAKYRRRWNWPRLRRLWYPAKKNCLDMFSTDGDLETKQRVNFFIFILVRFCGMWSCVIKQSDWIRKVTGKWNLTIFFFFAMNFKMAKGDDDMESSIWSCNP